MEWFRFYHEAVNDPKVQRLAPPLFKQRLEEVMDGTATSDNPFLRHVQGPFRRNHQEYVAGWSELRRRVFERDGFACQYCGSTDDLQCDHVIPRIRGGTNDESNLITACRTCNASKCDRLVEEWR